MKRTKTTHIHNNTKIAKKIINWREYNRALAKRSDFMFFLNKAIQKNALIKPSNRHTRGRQLEYSDELIKLILIYRTVYHMSLRAAVLFTRNILCQNNLICKIPDYTTISRRASSLNIDIIPSEYYIYQNDPIIFLVDSSGFKIHGEGEWFRKKHGISKPRQWQETHVGLDYLSRIILSVINTNCNVHDNTELMPLLMVADKNIRSNGTIRRLEAIIGDGAYENHMNYHLAEDLQAKFIAPPARNATMNVKIAYEQSTDVPGWEARNRVVEAIQLMGGIEEWKKTVRYHRRSLVENAFSRLKGAFGDKMLN